MIDVHCYAHVVLTSYVYKDQTTSVDVHFHETCTIVMFMVLVQKDWTTEYLYHAHYMLITRVCKSDRWIKSDWCWFSYMYVDKNFIISRIKNFYFVAVDVF